MPYGLEQLKATASLSPNASKEQTEQWVRAFYKTPSLDEASQPVQDAVLEMCGGMEGYLELVGYIESKRAEVAAVFEERTGVSYDDFVADIEARIAAMNAGEGT